MQKLSRKLTAKTLGFLLIPVLFLFFSTPKAGAVVGLSVGNDQLNLTGGQNVFYGVTSASNTAGSFLLLEKGYGNVVFKIDYAGNITTNGSVLGANNYWGFSGNNLFASSTAWNVGIGTTSPYSKLHLFDNTTGPIISLSGLNTNYRGLTVKDTGNSEQWFSGANNVNNFVIRRSGTTDNLTIASTTGYVGIGTTNPGAKLHVFEATSLGGTLGNSKIISRMAGGTSNTFMHNEWLYRDANGADWMTARWHDGISVDSSFLTPGTDTRVWWERDPNNNIQSWGNAASTYLTINTGNVGIGTTTPSYQLQVGSNAGGYASIGLDASTVFPKIYFGTNNSYIGYDYNGSERMILNSRYVNSHYEFQIAGSEKVRIDNAGNVGIGSTTPNIKLSVSNGSTGNVIDVGGANIGGLASTPTNPDQAVPLGYLQNNYNATSTSFWSGSLAGNISNANSGNVGIGTVSPGKSLEISTANGTEASLRIRQLTQNYWDFKIPATTTRLTIGDVNGDYLTILNLGNVGIGTTAPKNKLDVAGSMALGSYAGVNTAPSNSLIVSGNIGINSTTPNYRLSISSSTADVINVGGGFVSGLNSTPLNPDQAVPLGYLQGNYTPSSTINSTLFWGGSLSGNIYNANSGNVGIGTATPAQKLHVVGNSYFNGNVGVGTIAPGAKLDITGTETHVSGDLSGADAILRLYNNYNSDVAEKGSVITFEDNYSGTNRTTRAAIKGGTATAGNTADGFLSFYTDSGSANSMQERMRINQSGNVGIGTSNPGSKLTINNGGINVSSASNAINAAILDGGYAGTPVLNITRNYGAAAAAIYLGSGSTANPNTIDNNSDFAIRIAGAEKIRVTSGGNVGIGSTTPNIKLSVSNGSTGNVIDVGGANIGGLASTPTNPDQAVPLIYLQNNYNATSTSFWSGSLAGNISNANSGNVGIGTTNPAAKLQVGAGNGDGINIGVPNDSMTIATPLYGETGRYNINFYGWRDNTWNQIGAKISAIRRNIYLNNNALIQGMDLAFYTNGSGGDSTSNFQDLSTERMRIDYNGNVGIGTTAPGAKLEINGGLKFKNGATNPWDIYTSFNYTNSDLIFSSNGAEKIRVNANGQLCLGYTGAGCTGISGLVVNGNVGINTTAPKNKLDVAGSIALGSYAGVNTAPSNSLIVSGNIGINSTTPNYRLSISSSTADVINVGGGFVSGLNSTPINRDQAIPLGYLQDNYTSTSTINSTLFWGGSLSGNIYSANTGNVGIGTTVPATKLSVVGQVTASQGNPYTNAGYSFIGEGGYDTGIFSTGDGVLDLWSNNVNTLNVRTGNVGIGTTNPGDKLDIVGNAVDGTGMVFRAPNDTNDPQFQFRRLSGDIFNFRIRGSANSAALSIWDQSHGTADQGIVLKGNTVGINSSRTYAGSFSVNSGALMVSTGNNVGIGTTTPGGKLEVYSGDVKINGGNLLLANAAGQITTKLQSYNNASGLWLIQPTSQSLILADAVDWDRGLAITYTAGTTGAVGGLLRIGQLTKNSTAYTHGETALFTNGLERMRINSLGKVGIGSTTPSVSLSFGADTGDRINIAGGFVGGLTIIPVNRDHAVSYGFLKDNYFSYWNPSTADSNNIYNNNLGNVGIGTDTPAAKFQLNGGLILKHATVADTDYTASTTDYIIAYSSITANRTVTLPNSLCTPGRFFVVLDESGSASASKQIIIDPEGTTKIVGQNTFILGNPYNSVYVFCGNSAWYVL